LTKSTNFLAVLWKGHRFQKGTEKWEGGRKQEAQRNSSGARARIKQLAKASEELKQVLIGARSFGEVNRVCRKKIRQFTNPAMQPSRRGSGENRGALRPMGAKRASKGETTWLWRVCRKVRGEEAATPSGGPFRIRRGCGRVS